MKISRTLAAAALSGALVLGGTTVAFAANEGVPLSDTLVYNGVTYYKNSNGDFVPAPDSKDESGKDVDEVITAADMETHVKNGDAKAPESAEKESESESSSSEATSSESEAPESEETTEPKETTSEKATSETTTASESEKTSEPTETTEPKESESASETKSSASATSTESSDSSASATTTESTDASATTTPSSSKSAEPTPTKEPGDKKSSARDALSSKDGKPTPLAIFGIVAGVLAAVAAAFPVIAKTLNLNIKLPF